MGVACLKLEGRMKRPEYVAIVTRCTPTPSGRAGSPRRRSCGSWRPPSPARGFTQGYFLDQKGPDMFGTRQEGEDPRELFAQAPHHL